MRHRSPLNFFIHVALILVFSVSQMAGPGANQAVSASRAPAYPGQADLASLSAQLLDDPVAAVKELVERVYGTDEFQAQVAVGELLRRAGLPLVSISGPVTGIPDSLVLVDAPIYIELIPDLVRALRRGAFYTPDQLAILLDEVGFNTEPLDRRSLVAALGEWGKAPGDPPESLVAGATVRTLAGRRLQVLYDGVDLDTIQFDPLQVMLVLAHATSQTATVTKPTSRVAPPLTLFERLLGVQSIARASDAAEAGPCEALANLTKGEAPDAAQVRGSIQESLKKSWVEFIKSGSDVAGETLDKTLTFKDRGTAVLNTLLLLMGATIEVKPDKTVTHFSHVKASPDSHVKVEAIANFDSAIAEKNVACYGLAGIDVPPSKPLEGFRIRWYMTQAKGGPAGSFLQPISADLNKLNRGAGGGGGDVTGINGNSILELAPPVEDVEPPENSPKMVGTVQVTASLDKDIIPVALSDLLGLDNPLGFVVSETWALAIGAIQRAGLPSQSVDITVGYHGADIYVSKGETGLFLALWNGSIKMDIYTCGGLGGVWYGSGGLGTATQNILGSLPELIGVNIPDNVPPFKNEFHFSIDPTQAENVFDITPGVVTGTMRTNILTNSNANIIINRRLVRIVGEVEVLFGGSPLSTYTFGASTVYPVYAVPEDPRCPTPGAQFEN